MKLWGRICAGPTITSEQPRVAGALDVPAETKRGARSQLGQTFLTRGLAKPEPRGPNQELADGKGTKTLSRLYSCNSFLDIDDLSL
jgi:hypothetical protein